MLSCAVLNGCTGYIAGSSPSEAGKDGVGPSGGAPPSSVDPTLAFATSSGLRRLTRNEYANTVRSLFGVEVARSEQPKETIIEGHSQIAAAQKSGYADTEQYYALGEAIALKATPKVLGQLGCSDNACLANWGTELLHSAFRQPAPEAVKARYLAILSAEQAGATNEERVHTFISSVLSSPYFLYRQELGSGPAARAGGQRELSSYEVASRLSYLVWQDTPDQELLAAALQGTLAEPAARLTQLERLLADKKAQQGMRGFVFDWMGLFEDALSKKDAALLAGTSPTFSEEAEQGLSLLLDDLLSQPGAKFSDLLRTDQVMANAGLAQVLGLDARPTGFQKLSAPLEQRRGILGHPLVIAAHSKESGRSPFLLGKFIVENVLCQKIAPPPAAVPKVDGEDAAARTLRQSLEGLTQDQPCLGCHRQIGPPGFAFLSFDPIGRFQPNDPQGRPYDTAGELALPSVSQAVPFTNASELSAVLAEEPDVARCLARRLFRWSVGRFEAAGDKPALDALESEAIATNAGVSALLRRVVSAEDFTRVSVKP